MNEQKPERSNLMLVAAIGAVIGGVGFVGYEVMSGAFDASPIPVAVANFVGMLIGGAALGGIVLGLIYLALRRGLSADRAAR